MFKHISIFPMNPSTYLVFVLFWFRQVHAGTLLAVLLILFQVNLMSTEQPPWDKWTLDNSPETRRHAVWKPDNKPYEAPNFDCKCPPNDECKLDFEIDDKALDFLKLRGILKKREEAQLKNHMTLVKKSRRNRNNRRSNGPQTHQEPCCCPPPSNSMRGDH